MLGRFCSRDPIGYEGSGWNVVKYTGANPIGATDPTGKYIWVQPSAPMPWKYSCCSDTQVKELKTVRDDACDCISKAADLLNPMALR